jgi:BON domain-containing protein
MARVGRAGSAYFCVLFLLVLGAAGCSRGPSDAQLTAESQSRMGADPRVQTKQVQVIAKNGIVTLSGTAGSDAERMAAAEDASKIEGVKVVVNNLRVMDASQQAEPKPNPRTTASIVTLQSSSRTRIGLGVKPPQAPPPDRHRLPIPHCKAAEATVANSSPIPSGQNTLPIVTDSSDSYPTNANVPASTSNASTAAAQAAPTTTLPPPPEKVTVPDGSVLSVRLLESVNSDVNQPGDKFVASLALPVMVGERVVIPAEAGLQGKVVEVRNSGRFTGRSSLVLELTSVAYNGKNYQLRTSQYAKQGPARDMRSVETIGGGAGVGAILGAILGGGKGAAIGAVIGAGVGTGVQARSKGAQVRLPAESMISFRLETPLEVIPSSALQQAPKTDPGSSQDPFSDDRPVLKRRPGSKGADPSPDTGSPTSAPVTQPRPN